MIKGILRRNLQKILLLSGITMISVLFTIYSDSISAFALSALRLCALSVIPSLFPFMVLSALASKIASHLTHKGSSKAAVILSVFLGALCGFPVGAASVAAMHKNSLIPKYDAEHLCALCNNAGPAFVIGVIGHGFWGSGRLGMMFYICQLISAGIVFFIWRTMFCKARTDLIKNVPSVAQRHLSFIKNRSSANAAERAARIFCTSVSESSVSVIQICGYIVFFKVICDTLHMFMPHSPVSEIVYTVIAAILEFTTGSASAAELGGALGIALCGFTIGFSGISVIAQSTGILSKAGLSSIPLIVMKFLAGLLSAILSSVCCTFFDLADTVSVGHIEISYGKMAVFSVIIILTATIARIWIAFRQRRI